MREISEDLDLVSKRNKLNQILKEEKIGLVAKLLDQSTCEFPFECSNGEVIYPLSLEIIHSEKEARADGKQFIESREQFREWLRKLRNNYGLEMVRKNHFREIIRNGAISSSNLPLLATIDGDTIVIYNVRTKKDDEVCILNLELYKTEFIVNFK